MPSNQSLPDIGAFLRAYEASIRGEFGSRLSTRRGGTFDLAGGSAAVIWAAEARRDRDNFRQVYADTATRPALDRYVQRRYGATRIEETYGTGTARFERPTTAAGSDTIYTGTRLLVTLASGGLPVPYAVAADTLVGASALVVEVPIRATRPGPGVAISTSSVELDDEIFDATLVPTHITCADGTLREKDADYLARARAGQQDRRVGYTSSVERVCHEAGAANVVVLDSATFGPDLDAGVSYAYVADQGWSATDELLDACALAVEDARVAGCDMQVRGMEITPVTMELTVTLWDVLGSFNLLELRRVLLGALLDAFNRRPDFWVFSLDSIRGELVSAAPNAVQAIGISTTPSPPTPGFVATLPRYTLTGTDVALSFQSPS